MSLSQINKVIEQKNVSFSFNSLQFSFTGHNMDASVFYGTRQRDLQAVVPLNADDSDDGFDCDDDVADPDFILETANSNGFESDESNEAGENDQILLPNEEGDTSISKPTTPCNKKRKKRVGNIDAVQPSPEIPDEPLSRERQWRKKDIDNFCPPETAYTKPDNIQTPYQYFSQFITPEMISHIAHNPNFYSVQVMTKSIDTDDEEIQKFLAILLYMGIYKLPADGDYWSMQLWYDLVADIMSCKRFKCLKRYIHFTDNNGEQNKEDKFWKIKPLFEMFREQCKNVESSTLQSVDEVMVPYKGTRAGKLRQYVKNQPHKWGFKIFCRSSSCGIIHDLLLYQGKTTFCNENLDETEKDLLLGEKVLLVMTRSIKDPMSTVVFCDNFFTSFKLIKQLESKVGIKTLGTVRETRCGGARLLSDTDLKKKGRGQYDFSSSENIIAVKWHDNKCVTLLSNAVGVEPVGSVKRFDVQAKCKVEVPCPSIVLAYNKHMGGIDLSDMLVALYKTPLRSHRWYLPIFGYILDAAVANAWLLYKREAQMLNARHVPLKAFRCEIASTLVKVNKKVKVGRPLSATTTPKRGNPKKTARKKATSSDVRYDCIDHWPMPMGSEAQARGRCAYCPKGVSGFKCSKCDVFLCLKNKQTCFVEYHKK